VRGLQTGAAGPLGACWCVEAREEADGACLQFVTGQNKNQEEGGNAICGRERIHLPRIVGGRTSC